MSGQITSLILFAVVLTGLFSHTARANSRNLNFCTLILELSTEERRMFKSATIEMEEWILESHSSAALVRAHTPHWEQVSERLEDVGLGRALSWREKSALALLRIHPLLRTMRVGPGDYTTQQLAVLLLAGFTVKELNALAAQTPDSTD